MKFPFRSTGELRRVEHAGMLWVEFSSTADIEILAPCDGVVAPVPDVGLGSLIGLATGDWSLAFFPGPDFAPAHRFAYRWTACVPNAFVIHNALFERDLMLRDVASASARSGGVIVTRRNPTDGTITVDRPFSVDAETLPAAVQTFVETHWWDDTAGVLAAGASNIVLPFAAGERIAIVPGPVKICALYTADPEGAFLPSRAAPTFWFDAGEYLQRLSDGALLEEAETSPIPPRDDAARDAAVANAFRIDVENSAGPTVAVLRGGMQRVELAVQAGPVEVPEAVLLVTPSASADPSADRVLVAELAAAASDTGNWHVTRMPTGTDDLGSSPHVDITWSQIYPEESGAWPFRRALSTADGTVTIEFAAARNLVQDVSRAIDELFEVERGELEALAAHPPGHTRTTYAELELLRVVLSEIDRIDVTDGVPAPGRSEPLGVVIRRAIPRDFATRDRPAAIRNASATRARLATVIRACMTPTFLAQAAAAGPSGEDLLTDLPFVLSSLPQLGPARIALNDIVTRNFVVSRIKQGIAGMRSGLSLMMFAMARAAVADVRSGLAGGEAARRVLDQFLFSNPGLIAEVVDGVVESSTAGPNPARVFSVVPGRPPSVIPTGAGEIDPRVFSVETSPSTRFSVRIDARVSIADARAVISTVETTLTFVNLAMAVSSWAEAGFELRSVQAANVARYAASAAAGLLQLHDTFEVLQWLPQASVRAGEALAGTAVQRPNVATIAGFPTIRTIGGVLTIVASLIEMGVLLDQAWDEHEAGNDTAAVLLVIAASGSLLMAVGAGVATFASFPIVGASIMFVGLVITLVGNLSAAFSLPPEPSAAELRLNELLTNLGNCYFGRNYRRSIAMFDDVPRQIALLMGQSLGMIGWYRLHGDSIYLLIEGRALDLAPDRDERVSIEVRNASNGLLFSAGFNFRDVGGDLIVTTHSNVAVTADHRIRIRGTAERPLPLALVASVEVGISVGSFTFPPETNALISRAYEEVFDEGRFAFMSRTSLYPAASSPTEPLPPGFDLLVAVWP